MIPQLNRLSSEEQEFMLKAPILVAILIAGADGTIDRSEIKEAMAQARKKQNSSDGLTDLYREIGEDFEDKLKIVLGSYPTEVTQRNAVIVVELMKLNSILPKIDSAFASNFYKSLRDLAMKIAKSSGGLLGMNAVGAAEAMYVNLPMIKEPAH
ncbi:MAG TPA: hypothetical protein DGG95_08880 [Cytophagales bacterium]|jgi:hypothetical protein|nr:hypothetical protein [Cytophagales bacterium]